MELNAIEDINDIINVIKLNINVIIQRFKQNWCVKFRTCIKTNQENSKSLGQRNQWNNFELLIRTCLGTQPKGVLG